MHLTVSWDTQGHVVCKKVLVLSGLYFSGPPWTSPLPRQALLQAVLGYQLIFRRTGYRLGVRMAGTVTGLELNDRPLLLCL